jgi:hypothetical protein
MSKFGSQKTLSKSPQAGIFAWMGEKNKKKENQKRTAVPRTNKYTVGPPRAARQSHEEQRTLTAECRIRALLVVDMEYNWLWLVLFLFFSCPEKVFNSQ